MATWTAVKQLKDREQIVADMEDFLKSDLYKEGEKNIISSVYHSTTEKNAEVIEVGGLRFNSRLVLKSPEENDGEDEQNQKPPVDGFPALFLCGTLYKGDLPDMSPYGKRMIIRPTICLKGYRFFYADRWIFSRGYDNNYLLIIAAKGGVGGYLSNFVVEDDGGAIIEWKDETLRIWHGKMSWVEILVLEDSDDNEVFAVNIAGTIKNVGTFAGKSHTTRPENNFTEEIKNLP
jgi:hypothetical protein